MELIEGAVRHYDWGSLTAIPDLLGRPATGEPWAELWLGAHPAAPATVGSRAEPLDRAIAADPVAALGPAVASRYGRLPFLFKVLAAAASTLVVGPAVLLCTDGCVEANGVILDRGTAAWSGAGEPEVALVGKGTLFCASVPREG